MSKTWPSCPSWFPAVQTEASIYLPSPLLTSTLLLSASEFVEGLQPSRLETTNSFVALVMSLCCWED